jgi:Transposase DDE domain
VTALALLEPHVDRPHAITLCADRGYEAADFVDELQAMRVTPRVAQNTSRRRSAIDGRTTRHAGYGVGQRIRKRIEEAFGWIKIVAGQKKTRFCSVERVGLAFTFTATAYNLVCLSRPLEPLRVASSCEVIGRWRIVGTDMWDRDYLDLVDPAFISIGHHGQGELAFVAVNASLDLAYSCILVF